MLEILTTGGTIDKVYFDKKSNYEVGDPFVEELLHKMNVNISFKVKSLMKIDSLDMTDIHREEILNYVKNSTANNFLITHGTDSIVETAIYLKKISNQHYHFSTIKKQHGIMHQLDGAANELGEYFVIQHVYVCCHI